ncbi:glycosyltransferase [Pseudomonadales bacterium]|nr:glycosyltransferase [Pseudomonadales bacterium]
MDLSEEKLTVIMPTTLSNEQHLNECIHSLEMQTLEKFELLVLVDGSALNHGDVARHFSNFSRPYRLLISKKRRGVSRSLNILARTARTVYLARMDDDDIALPARLEQQLSLIEGKNFDVVGSAVTLINAEGGTIDEKRLALDFSKKVLLRDLVFGEVFFHPTVVYLRTWVLKHKYCRSWGNGQDRELWMRAFSASRYFNSEEVLLKYRVRALHNDVFLRATRNKMLLIDKFFYNSKLRFILRLRVHFQRAKLIGYRFLQRLHG